MKNLFFLFLCFSFCLLNIKNETNINILQGVYNIISSQSNFPIYYHKDLKLKKEVLGSEKINFRVNIKRTENESKINYLTIQHLQSNLFLGIEKDNFTTNILMSKNINENKTVSFEYYFKEIEDKIYIIQNKLGCYLKENNSQIQCSFEPLDKYSNFYLLKLFSEIDKTNIEDLKILEKEPIDVLIKYIDLTDPSLIRTGIKQITKDIQNDEIRYCIRSILQNIPWIRKIFILMPNEKISFLQNKELIKDKIVFIKDKDFLGYDSSNIHAFQFRLWKMKQFGISDNFIVMDDDYFIGKPLNKSDFFYVDNDTVVPAIIANKFQIHNNISFLKEYNKVKNNLDKSKPQSSNNFMYTIYNTYFFWINEFEKNITVPYFTHNAIPINIKDLKEIYDLINKSKYRFATLDSLYRHRDTLQFQTAVNIYTFNKYRRKVNIIKYSYIDVEYTIKGNYDVSLFCINTGGNKDYSKLSHLKAKISMNKIFPNPIKYEIINYTDIPYTSFQIVKQLNRQIKNLKTMKANNQIIQLKKESKIKLDFINNFESLSAKYNKDNKLLLNEIINIRNNYDSCLNRSYNLENDINNFHEIEKMAEIKNNNIIKMKEFELIKNETFEKFKNMENNNNKLYLIIYFEILVLIILLLVLFFLCFYANKNKEYFDKKKVVLI